MIKIILMIMLLIIRIFSFDKELPYPNALVVAKEQYELIIDKGYSDGVEEGDIVVQNEALVGIINEVKKNESSVKLITNNQNKLSVKTADNNLYGLIDKYENSYLILSGVKSENVEIGSKILTTGISYIYPDNLYVGEVYSIIYDESKPIIVVKTPVDFDNISEVLILKR